MAPKPVLFVLSLTVLMSVLAMSTQGSPTSLSRRGKAGIIKGILEAIGVFTEEEKIYAWVRVAYLDLSLNKLQLIPLKDWETHSHMCKVFFRTKDGGNCEASVECQNGGHVKV